MIIFNKKNLKKIKNKSFEGRLIKEACDMLPIGICIGTMEGIPRLTNEKMRELANIITGVNLNDANIFWEDLCNFKSNENAVKVDFTDSPTIRVKGGHIYNFTKRNILFEDVEHNEILASIVTDKYELSMQLLDENEELKKQARELDKLRESIAILNRDEEVLESKMRVHYELGRVILSSRNYLQADSMIKKDELINMWNEALLVFENPLFSEKASFDFMGELKSMALSNGCELSFEGIIEANEEIVMTIIREALVNAVRHGNATKVTVFGLKENDSANEYDYVLKIVDNGMGINSGHYQKGGLEDLEIKIEKYGGKMKLQNRLDAVGAILEARLHIKK